MLDDIYNGRMFNNIDFDNVLYATFKPKYGILIHYINNKRYFVGQFEDISEKQMKKDIIYLGMATLWSQNSHCKRKKVGTLIVKDNVIISDGYNGTPYGFDNICEKNDSTLDIVLHAESNAITKLSRSTNSSIGASMYNTLSPCIECGKLIHQCGIKEFIFSSIYRDTSGLDFLMKTDILIRYINKKLIDDKILNTFDI